MDGLVPFCEDTGAPNLGPAATPCSLCLGYRLGAFAARSAHWAFSLKAQFLRPQITALNLVRSHGIQLLQGTLSLQGQRPLDL